MYAAAMDRRRRPSRLGSERSYCFDHPSLIDETPFVRGSRRSEAKTRCTYSIVHKAPSRPSLFREMCPAMRQDDQKNERRLCGSKAYSRSLTKKRMTIKIPQSNAGIRNAFTLQAVLFGEEYFGLHAIWLGGWFYLSLRFLSKFQRWVKRNLRVVASAGDGVVENSYLVTRHLLGLRCSISLGCFGARRRTRLPWCLTIRLHSACVYCWHSASSLPYCVGA